MPDLSVSKAASKAPGNHILELVDVVKVFHKEPDLIAKGLELVNLKRPGPRVTAIKGISLSLRQGDILGLVGESGCGKSTLGNIISLLLKPSSGTILFDGQDIAGMSKSERARVNLATQMIFQDPSSSLNPRIRIGQQIAAAPLYHKMIKPSEVDGFVADILRKVGLDPEVKDRFPGEFSGGQRQRIGIARALAVNPKILICDESVASLDVSIQAQVLNLLMDLNRDLNLTIVFVSHDLGVVRHVSDQVAVMYLGEIVEAGPSAEVFANPQHPYTRVLMEEIPSIDGEKRSFARIDGEVPSPLNPPSGCHFHPRCPVAMEVCSKIAPELVTRPSLGSGHRRVACHAVAVDQ